MSSLPDLAVPRIPWADLPPQFTVTLEFDVDDNPDHQVSVDWPGAIAGPDLAVVSRILIHAARILAETEHRIVQPAKEEAAK